MYYFRPLTYYYLDLLDFESWVELVYVIVLGDYPVVTILEYESTFLWIHPFFPHDLPRHARVIILLGAHILHLAVSLRRPSYLAFLGLSHPIT